MFTPALTDAFTQGLKKSKDALLMPLSDAWRRVKMRLSVNTCRKYNYA